MLAALNNFDNRLAESDLNLQLIKAKHMDKNDEVEDVGSARMISEQEIINDLKSEKDTILRKLKNFEDQNKELTIQHNQIKKASE